MKKSTQELLDILKNTPSFSDYTEQEEPELVQVSVSDYLNQLIHTKNQDLPSLIRKSGLDRNYCYQIFDGRKRPSRDKVLALCFAMHLSFTEVQNLLKATGYPILHARIERDSAIIFSLQRNCALSDVNELLYELGYKELA